MRFFMTDQVYNIKKDCNIQACPDGTQSWNKAALIQHHFFGWQLAANYIKMYAILEEMEQIPNPLGTKEW